MLALGSVIKTPFVPGTRRVVCQSSSRPMWLVGADAPPYLNGSLAGDYGFDPLSLGADPDRLKWSSFAFATSWKREQVCRGREDQRKMGYDGCSRNSVYRSFGSGR